ncbi:MAG: GHKL domain-containing protein [Firmicutes bacterium]|nr:GHKL domain-containing protein [Bacillota bacterium]
MSIGFERFISSVILTFYAFYTWKILYNQNVKLKLWKKVLAFMLVVGFSIVNYVYINRFISIIVLTIFLTFINYYLYRDSLKISILTTVIAQLILTAGEVLFVLIVVGLQNIMNINSVIEKTGTLMANVFICVFALIILNCKTIQKLCERIIGRTNKINSIQIIVPLMILIISLNLLLAQSYYKVNGVVLLIINTLLLIIYTYIIVRAFKEKNKYIEVQAENKELSSHLTEYEQILSKQRRTNHENKTELIVIRDMIHKNNKKALDYINEMIGSKNVLEETFYELCQKIPTGIQGIVYQRVLLADKDIQVDINVSPELENANLEKQLTASEFLDVCKIVGVFLGNAFEEVREIKDGEKIVSIHVYQEEDTFVIQLANTYRKGTDFSKIGDTGYTTKGKEHGQGLSLVKELEKNHANIYHETEIMGKLFLQKLKIKGLKF